MVIEMLPALVMAIRAAAIANDNDNAVAGDGGNAPGVEPPAEPSAAAPGSQRAPVPLVRTLRRRPGASYATAGNVILPLVFAERMPGWRARKVNPSSSP